MADTAFQVWRSVHTYIEDHLFYPEGKESQWARMDATWHEKKEDGIELVHHCAFTINVFSGDVYLDCSKTKIWAKCFLLNFGRPYLGCIKTVYHLILPLSIPVEIFIAVRKGIEEKQTFKQITIKASIAVIHNVVDIVRTPLYTIVITIITLEATLLGPNSCKLYDLRATAGRLENALNRGEQSFWTLAPCFQPLSSMLTIHHRDYTEKDTIYDSEPTLKGFNNLVRSYILFQRNHRGAFNNCFHLLPPDAPYKSSVFD